MPISRAFLYTSSKVTSKTAPPPRTGDVSRCGKKDWGLGWVCSYVPKMHYVCQFRTDPTITAPILRPYTVLRTYFKHDSDVGRQGQSLAIGQRQQLVVIQHRIQVFYPLRIHIAIKDDPLSFIDLATHVVNYLPTNVTDKTTS